MSVEQILFILIGLVTLVSAFMVVTSKRMMYSALWLMLSLFSVAILFVLLDSSFFAIAQVVVYIGTISILIIFAVMLTREAQESGPVFNRFSWLAGIAVILVAGTLVFFLSQWGQFSALPAGELSAEAMDIGSLGKAFTDPDAFVIPFEVASILLLAAMIGAVYLAKPFSGGKG